MASTRAQQAERTRQTVLDTARRLFAERGFDATSLQLIADAMGVQKANVYYYFRTKLAILEALLDNNITAFEALLDAAAAIEDDRRRREHLVHGFVDQVVASRSIAPLSQTDPGMRRESRIRQTLDEQSTRGLRLMFGDRPTADEQAAYYMAADVGPAMRQLTEVSDDELRDILRRLCLRILDIP